MDDYKAVLSNMSHVYDYDFSQSVKPEYSESLSTFVARGGNGQYDQADDTGA